MPQDTNPLLEYFKQQREALTQNFAAQLASQREYFNQAYTRAKQESQHRISHADAISRSSRRARLDALVGDAIGGQNEAAGRRRENFFNSSRRTQRTGKVFSSLLD